MKLPSFLFILYFISIIKGASIKNFFVHSATAGIITYENLKSKIYATSLHPDFRKHILENFENEKYENTRFDADGRNRRITGAYFKRIFLPDRWHELFYFYSFTTIVEELIECFIVSMLMFHNILMDVMWNILKENLLIEFKDKLKLNFLLLLMKIIKNNFMLNIQI